jgi:lipopolysaccharide transport system permease protein
MAELIIEAGRTEGQYWRDLWRYRELFYVLAWRDITVRYKQTAIGIMWALLQPLLTTIILTIIFEYFAGMKSQGSAPYAILVMAGAMPWYFFTASLGGSTQSVIGNANLISKIYFPRLIVPAGAVVTALADLLISFLVLLAMMVWYRFWPTWHFLALPVFVLLGFVAAMGPGLLFTALTVKYRDFRYIIPFVMQIGAYISPVGYASSRVPEKWRLLYSLNPMVGVIDGFRWSILGKNAPLDLRTFVFSVIVAIGVMIWGIWYFRHTEKSFADVI